MRFLRPVTLLSALFTLSLLAGCKSDCRRLAEQLCDCSTNTVERESCLRSVQSREATVDVTDEDNARCEALIPQCDCRALDPSQPGSTPESIADAKRACGLARQ